MKDNEEQNAESQLTFESIEDLLSGDIYTAENSDLLATLLEEECPE